MLGGKCAVSPVIVPSFSVMVPNETKCPVASGQLTAGLVYPAMCCEGARQNENTPVRIAVTIPSYGIISFLLFTSNLFLCRDNRDLREL